MSEMLFGDIPSFDAIMDGLRHLEATINAFSPLPRTS